jgi:hypothetical protein
MADASLRLPDSRGSWVRPENFTWAEFLAHEVQQANALFTPLVRILAALSLYDMARWRSGAVLSDPLLMVGLLLFRAIHLVLFSVGAWQHDYWLFYCSAALSVLAANGAVSHAGATLDRRVLGFVGVLLVLSALPRIQYLYSYHLDPAHFGYPGVWFVLY